MKPEEPVVSESLLGQLVNDADGQPLPGVHVRGTAEGAAATVTNSFGEFELGLGAQRVSKGKRNVASAIELAAPDETRVELCGDPASDGPVVVLRARVEPHAIEGVDWRVVSRILGEAAPRTVGALARELVHPSSFGLARVPREDRERHLRALQAAALDPEGVLRTHLPGEAISAAALRDRTAGARIGETIEALRLPPEDATAVRSVLDKAVVTAARAPLFALELPLAEVRELGAAFGPAGDGAAWRASRLAERWAGAVERLGLREPLGVVADQAARASPRALLAAAARMKPGERPKELGAVTAAARLTVLGAAPEVAVALVQDGLDSARALARAPLARVAQALGGDARRPEAVRLQTRARQALSLARARLAEAAPAVAPATKGIALYRSDEVGRAGGVVALLAGSQPEDACAACEDCTSALSPGAYLVDLLDFLSDGFGWTLPQLEERFLQPFAQLPLDCDAVETKDLQIAFANEVLARLVRARRSLDWRQLDGAARDALYDEFAALAGAGVFPLALPEAYEVYRGELRADPAAIQAALPDPAARAALAGTLGVDEADLAQLVLAPAAVHWSTLGQLHELLVKARRTLLARLLEENLRAETYAAARERLLAGLDAADPANAVQVQQAEAAAAAEATSAVVVAGPSLAVQAEGEARAYAATVKHRLDKVLLPRCRANLIALALRALQARPVPGRTLANARQMGDYLGVDLEAGDCLETTRVAFAIEALQSFVQSYLLGREPVQAPAFDLRRWRWMKSYGLWGAAQAVFLYPENFLSPQFRSGRTPSLERMMERFEAGPASRPRAREALLSFGDELRDFTGASTFRAVQAGDRLHLFAVGAVSRYLYMSSVDASGAWTPWERIEELRGQVRPPYIPGPDLQDVVALGERIYVVYRDEGFKALALVIPAGGGPRTTFEIAPQDVARVRAAVIQTPARQEVLFLVQRFPPQPPPPAGTLIPLDAYTLGAGDQQAVAAEKKVYLPPNTQLLGMACHAAGSGSTQLFNPKLLVAYLRVPAYQIAVAHVPASLVPAAPDMQGDVLLDSFPGAAIAVGQNVSPSGFTMASFGPRAWGETGVDRYVVAYHRPAASGGEWRVASVNGASGAIERQVGSSGNPPGVPAALRAEWLTGVARFDGALYGTFGRWLARLPAPTDDWQAPQSWGLVGQPTLGPEVAGRTLRVDLDALAAPASLPAYRALQAEHWDAFQGGGYARRYVEELFLHAPLWLSARLNEEGRFEAAREVLELVFRPFGSGLPAPFLYEGILREQAQTSPALDFRNTVAYLQQPFDPHAIAGVRPLSYARHAVQVYVDNLLDWADAEFTRDTAESVAAARELYESAGDILGLDAVPEDLCAAGYGTLLLQVLKALPGAVASTWRPLLEAIWKELHRLGSTQRTREVVDELRGILASNASEPKKRAALLRVLMGLRGRNAAPARTVRDARRAREDAGRSDELELWGLGRLEVLDALDDLGSVSTELPVTEVPAAFFDFGFCIPRNPAYEALRFRVDANLEKIRTCRNIAGIRRSLESYAVVQDPTALIQQAQAAGGDLEDFIPAEPPPMFRYGYLWERARQATTTAQHLESYLLTSLEKLDAAEYTLLQARNDLKLASADVAVHALRVREASLGVTQATLQRDRAVFSSTHFQELLQAGNNGFEQTALILLRIASFVPSSVSVSFGMSPSVSVGVSPSGILQNEATIQNTLASYERRAEEWRYQRDLADWDAKIAEGQIDVAGAQVDIASEELQVASLTAEQAGGMVAFLTEQFTSAELYRWMVRELRKLYRRSLSLAVGLGRAAQQALAFELQEPLNFVGTQYGDSKREGLLGSEQLAVDLDRLDQHRLAKAERRRELTKTVSLALRMPSEFQALRETGLLTFTTPASWFDRDFPGHYMRLVKSVEFSVIALTPALEGIRANVSHHGLSRVMVGPPFAAPVILQRPPETVSLSSPRTDGGLFQLRLDDPMLLPFEGSGVEATWTLELAKAANAFNFDTLVDVLMTIRYTAKEDFGYRQRIVAELESGFTAMASFAARQTFPDAWFHLHNPVFRQNAADYGFGPGQVRPPYTFRVEIGRGHFPPNELDVTLRRILVVTAQDRPGRIPVRVEFRPAGGAATLVANDQEIVDGALSLGVFSGRPPFGTWTVQLRSDASAAAYPEFFAGSGQELGQTRLDLAGLRELLLVMEYGAHVRYPRP